MSVEEVAALYGWDDDQMAAHLADREAVHPVEPSPADRERVARVQLEARTAAGG